MYLYIFSVLLTCGSLIGNKIGERRPESAKKIIESVLKFGLLYSIICIACFYMFRYWMYRFYTRNESVLEKMNKLTLVCVLNLFVNIMKDITTTILIGIGIQNKTVTFNIVSYAVVAIPISIFAIFYLKWAYTGPWIGVIISTGANAAYYYILYLKNLREHSYFWKAKDIDLPEYNHEK